jgi:tetratricopeptide (TPR) repeat protein
MTPALPLCIAQSLAGRVQLGATAVDFDAVHDDLVAPAAAAAGFEALRVAADTLDRAALERLLLAEAAVADLTGADATVFYALGIRHARRSTGTVAIMAAGAPPPPGAHLLRPVLYQVGPDGRPSAAEADRAELAQRLADARARRAADSPIYELLDEYPDIAREKTDLFRERARYALDVKARLKAARGSGREAVAAVEAALGDLAAAEAGVVVDLFLSYRAVKAWDDMARLADAMPAHVARTPMIQEQKAFALNRLGRSEAAEEILRAIVKQRGASSETNGLLGRVYKDRWEAQAKAGRAALAGAALRKAIDAYRQGFEADWRDAFPGVNAVTLMELRTPPDPERHRLLPVVRYAVERRMARTAPDYWDYATLLELAAIENDPDEAGRWLGEAAAHCREAWEAETTARNLRLVRETRMTRNEDAAWIGDLEQELLAAAAARAGAKG